MTLAPLLFKRALLLLMVLCWGFGAQAQGSDIPDPLEPVNRVGHVINKELDRFIVRPASEAWEAYVPSPVKVSILSFNSTWGLPMRGINSGLQGNPDEMMQSLARFH